MIEHSFWFYGAAFFGIILVRYLLVAGGAYLFFYTPWRFSAANPNVPAWSPSRQLIQHDIILSIYSAGVFALAAAFVLLAYNWGITRLYSQAQPYDLWYFAVSYGAVLVLQDAYFYFTHRLFHHPALFPWVHQGHHCSRHPTPWTSFAFDPLEAVAQALFLIAIIFVIPLHFITLIAVLTTMTVWAVVTHLGVEQLPSSFPHHWLGRWFIGPAHHSIHHRQYTVHYGLYFTFWDKLFGTQSPKYEEMFDPLPVRKTDNL